MLLGFKRRFAPFVEDGSKTHTIRSERKNAPRPGETCHCYVDPRQKTMRLLGRFPCVKVEPIEIYERGDGTFGVVIAGEELTPDEKDALAWRDGFRSLRRGQFMEMAEFWMKVHADGRPVFFSRVNHAAGEPFVRPGRKALEFSGHIIHWQYKRALSSPGKGNER